MTVPIPFATQAYQLRQVQFAAQRCINLFPELGPPGAKVPLALIGTPGLTQYADVGTGPIRGLIKMQEFLFVISGSELYRLSVNGDTFFLGQLPGTGLVKLASNGTQILILTGTSDSDGFIATTTTLEQITDEDFVGGSDCDFIDGYFVISRPETNEFYISALYNGLEYDPLDFARAEGAPDDIIGLVVDHREIWLMCERTTEVWYNSGNADFPFERASGTFIERGLAARDSIAQVDNTIMWVGNDRIVYRADGYSPLRISQHAIEQKINEALGTGDLVAFGYSQDGHSQYVLKKPNEWTFVYDSATQLWHERESYQRPDYKVSTYAAAFNRLLVGDDRIGRLYTIDASRPNREDGETVVSRMAAPPLFANEEEAVLNALVVDFERGVGRDDEEFITEDIRIRELPSGEFSTDARIITGSVVTQSAFEVPRISANSALFAFVAWKQGANASIDGVTFRNIPMELSTELVAPGSPDVAIRIYTLQRPVGTGDIVATFDSDPESAIMTCFVMDGVDLLSDIILESVTGSDTGSLVTSITPSGVPSLILSFFVGNDAAEIKPFGMAEEEVVTGYHVENKWGVALWGQTIWGDPGTLAQDEMSIGAGEKLVESNGSPVSLGWEVDGSETFNACGLILASFRAATVVRDPKVMLRYSDDGGLTWSNEKWRSLGRVGEYKRRARWNRMGRFRQRVLEISISDPVRRTIMGAYAKLERGSL